ncbi:hypothetical protein [Arthrobacter sp. ERGS1:01]|uniref:hypothetical protein n=1 Tax=Arthrobacter sp. ERGS1:01 TaxID=1704044 RepID=UPI0012373D54|nr:hypothetical protein [Arthrobacter sp. ERGS1:01]
MTSVNVTAGETINEGKLLATLNGQPVISIFGAFPLYRDLKLSDEGPDAKLVNDFLGRTGYLVGNDLAPKVTEWTITAMKNFLRDQGFPISSSGTWAIPSTYFVVLPSASTIISDPPTSGVAATDEFFKAGYGGTGLSCTGRDGKIPAAIASGQEITVASFGPGKQAKLELRDGPTSTAASQLPSTSGSSTSQGSPPASGGAGQKVAWAALPGGVKVPVGKVEGTVVLKGTENAELVVPSSALWTKGTSLVVTRANADGTQTNVEVAVVFSANGNNAVRPTVKGQLKLGDKVIVARAS